MANHKLMCILAHPDDESLGTGGTLAKYAREGVETYLVTATRGENGRFGDNSNRPSATEVGRVRENELRCAAGKLGIREVHFLDYVDGELDQADPHEIVGRIVKQLRVIQPQVVITFGPEGGYGHPDHIAVSQYATSAIVSSADSDYKVKGNSSPHRVSKLYYMAWTRPKWEAYQAALRNLKITVDGYERQASPWADWAITTVIDTRDYWPVTWSAVCCHETQMAIYRQLENLPEEQHRAIWGIQEYYRVFSLVNGGRKRETDLFEGIG